MNFLQDQILKQTEATEITGEQSVQTLWSGYGEIKRYFLKEGRQSSIIVKHINWSAINNHPRGWNTTLSHDRKCRSYEVEKIWYHQFSPLTNDQCRVPDVFHVMEEKDQLIILLEDLDQNGYPLRASPGQVTIDQVKHGLSWLANFHARFMRYQPEGLWPIGTYWHLDTRPDEWKKMNNIPLKEIAKSIDQKLNQAQFQTIVHGDAKLANFCFSETDKVAAVDFQYVGQGCGMKDVAYFLSSCLEDSACENYEKELLTHYFEQLETALGDSFDFESIKAEWQNLYAYAWADFYRFLDGWSPGHWKMHGYSERLTQQVIDDLTE